MLMHNSQRRGFTLVELLVVIAIIALLLSILLPSLDRARAVARTVLCKSNMKSQITAINMYSQDIRGRLVPCMLYTEGEVLVTTWVGYLVATGFTPATTYDNRNDLPTSTSIYQCPDQIRESATPSSYGNSPLGPSDMYDVQGAKIWNMEIQVNGTTKYVPQSYAINGYTNNIERWSTGRTNLPMFESIKDRVAYMGLQLNTLRISRIPNIASWVAITDGSWITSLTRVNARHLKRTVTNVAMLDGHVEDFQPGLTPNFYNDPTVGPTFLWPANGW